MDKDWLERYLDLLGIKGREPTFETLREVASAHKRVSFANAPSLLRKAATPHGPVPALNNDEVLTAWSTTFAGGVCYELSAMVRDLLQGLNFDAYVVMASIQNPRLHHANIVRLGDQRFLLDLGNGAPLFEPIPIDEGPQEIEFAGLAYRFERLGDEGALTQSRWIDGQWKPFASYEAEPATVEDQLEGFQSHHQLPAKSFVMQNFTLVQTGEDAVLALVNHTFTYYKRSGKVSRDVQGIDAYRGVIRAEFGLAAYPVDEALAAWSKVTGATI